MPLQLQGAHQFPALANAGLIQYGAAPEKRSLESKRHYNNRLAQYNVDNANIDLYNQLQLQKEQRAYDLQMWQMENDYNDPANVRQRMEAAGFSPQFMNSGSMGSGGSVTQHSSLQPTGRPSLQDNARNATIFDLADSVLQKVLQFKSMKLQETKLDNAQSNADREYERNLVKDSLANSILQERINQLQLSNRFNKDAYKDRLAALSLANAYKRSSIREIDDKILSRQALFPLEYSYKAAQIAAVRNGINVANSRLDLDLWKEHNRQNNWFTEFNFGKDKYYRDSFTDYNALAYDIVNGQSSVGQVASFLFKNLALNLFKPKNNSFLNSAGASLGKLVPLLFSPVK